MEITTYVQALITTGGIIMGIWGFIKVVSDIKKTNDDEVKRRAGWDYAAKVIKDKEKKWDDGLADVYREREKITEEFTERLDEQDAKIQQLTAMILLALKSVNALLEHEIETGANGDVKKMHDELNAFIYNEIGK